MNIIKETEQFISNKVEGIKALFSLITLEAQLAGLSIYPVLITLCLLFAIAITTWWALVVFIGYVFIITLHSVLWAILFVLFLNIGLISALLAYLSFNLKNMSFPKTREYFAYDHDEKNIEGKDCSDRNQAQLP